MPDAPIEAIVTDDPRRKPEDGVALCLSGGGYRAMLFHLGALWRLYETSIRQKRGILKKLGDYTEELLQKNLQAFVDWIKAFEASAAPDEQQELAAEVARLPALDRYAALAALILAAESEQSPGIVELAGDAAITRKAAELAAEFFRVIAKDKAPTEPQVWQVALNRNATPALTKSVPAIKADAARTLFNVNCGEIAWAVIDSGIDGNHHAFEDSHGKTRIQSYSANRQLGQRRACEAPGGAQFITGHPPQRSH